MMDWDGELMVVAWGLRARIESGGKQLSAFLFRCEGVIVGWRDADDGDRSDRLCLKSPRSW